MMEKFWFRIIPEVFIWKNNSKILLYSTIDFNILEFENDSIFEAKYEEIMNPDNLYCIEITENELLNTTFQQHLKMIVDARMADFINFNINPQRPVSLPPILGIQRSREKFNKDPNILNYENFLLYLHEVTIYLNGNIMEDDLFYMQTPYFLSDGVHLNYTDLCALLKYLPYTSINEIKLVAYNIFEYENFMFIMNQLDKIHAIKKIYCSCSQFMENIELIKIINSEQFRLVIIVDERHPFEQDIISFMHNIEWLFCVTSVSEYEFMESLIKKHKIENFTIKPIYTGNNFSFFEEYIYMTKDDILSSHCSKKEIFINQTLNINDYGKLIILPGGDVYANINFPKLGNIKTDTIQKMICNEILSGNSWLRIRDQKPCINCIYQWLCPSPSNYELVIGKPNLCHVKP